jgi:hypothetical protein
LDPGGNTNDWTRFGFRFTDLTRENFGKIVTKRGHRVVQLAARFEF